VVTPPSGAVTLRQPMSIAISPASHEVVYDAVRI
jgi:hypothetical protein